MRRTDTKTKIAMSISNKVNSLPYAQSSSVVSRAAGRDAILRLVSAAGVHRAGATAQGSPTFPGPFIYRNIVIAGAWCSAMIDSYLKLRYVTLKVITSINFWLLSDKFKWPKDLKDVYLEVYMRLEFIFEQFTKCCCLGRVALRVGTLSLRYPPSQGQPANKVFLYTQLIIIDTLGNHD